MSRFLAALGHEPSLTPIPKASRTWPDIVSSYGAGVAIPSTSATDYATLAKTYCEVIYVHVSISRVARALAFRPLKWYQANSKTGKEHF